MNINFIPQWYLENNNKRIIKIYSIILAIILAINLLLFNKAMWNFKNITNLKNEIYNINLKNNKNFNINNKKDKNYTLLQSIYTCLNKDIIIDSFSIKDEKIILEARCFDLDNYYKLLNSLEHNKNISIKNLSAPEKQEPSNLKNQEGSINSSANNKETLSDKVKEEIADSSTKEKEQIINSDYQKEENPAYKFKFILE